MRYRPVLWLVLTPVSLLAAVLLGCRRPTSAPPGRIVSLVPSVTEIVYALGQEHQLVGNTTFCDYPEAAKKLAKVGDFSNPSVERIAALKPRLVFATLPEQRAAVERLRKMGFEVFITRPKGLDSLLAEISSIGSVLGASSQADSLVQVLRARLERIPCCSVKARVYVELSSQPLISVGQGTFVSEAITRAGGQNVFGEISKEYPIVTQEQVIAQDPEVIFILHPQTNRTELCNRLGWQGITAVRKSRVFDDINPDLLLRPGPRIVDGIEALAQRIQAIGPSQGQ